MTRKVKYTVSTNSLEEFKKMVGLIEGLEPQAEQMQSVARQQDAALSPDESGRSAAGNPTDSLEAFEAWVRTNRETLNEVTDEISYEDIASGWDFIESLLACIQHYRSRGAA